MRKGIPAALYIGIILLALVVTFGAVYFWPRASTEIAFTANPLPSSGAVTASQLTSASDIIAGRLANMPINQFSVRIDGPNRIVADLTTNIDQQALADVLTQRGFIELIDTGGSCPTAGTFLYTSVDSSSSSEPIASTEVYTTLITGEDVDPASVQAGLDPVFGAPQVSFDLKGAPVKQVLHFASSQRDVIAAVTLDKQLVACFNLPYPINSKRIVISDLPSEAVARKLSLFLRSEALPVQLTSTTGSYP